MDNTSNSGSGTTNSKKNKSKAAGKNIHKGHRERMRNRFYASDASALEDHELLEMFLFYVNSRVNTNDIAHRLIQEFGSLRAIFNAPPERLCAVLGVGESTALFFSLFSELRKRIRMEKYSSKVFKATSLSEVGEYLMTYYTDMDHEQLCAMLMDSSLKLIKFEVISNGGINGTAFDVPSFVKYALNSRAAYVILAHNHPSGNCDLSPEDVDVTARLERALSAVEIALLEHIIVGDVTFVPTMQLRSRGLRLTTSKEFLSPEMLRKFYNS